MNAMCTGTTVFACGKTTEGGWRMIECRVFLLAERKGESERRAKVVSDCLYANGEALIYKR